MPQTHHARTLDRQCRSCQSADPIPDESAGLSGSVGDGGSNRSDDVSAVQSRLNQVETADGGPAVPLAVDGLCGPLTRAAIKRFQQRYPGQLIGDGRIDVNKNTWKKLVALSEGEASTIAGLPKAPISPAAAAQAASDAANLVLLNAGLYLSQYRIFEAIKALDVAANELTACEAKTWLNVGPKPLTLFESYQESQAGFKELPTVDRCFHIASAHMTAGVARETLRRVRKVYTDMVDVIVRNSFTTLEDEKSGKRRFIRLVSDHYMKRTYPPRGAIASAPMGGWWDKNANVSHIRFNSSRIGDGDGITTLIHEMSHFVSHHSSYVIGDHHRSGEYNGAFNDTHAQAVRNSFCYEWYSFLASFKHQRGTPNAGLVLT